MIKVRRREPMDPVREAFLWGAIIGVACGASVVLFVLGALV